MNCALSPFTIKYATRDFPLTYATLSSVSCTTYLGLFPPRMVELILEKWQNGAFCEVATGAAAARARGLTRVGLRRRRARGAALQAARACSPPSTCTYKQCTQDSARASKRQCGMKRHGKLDRLRLQKYVARKVEAGSATCRPCSSVYVRIGIATDTSATHRAMVYANVEHVSVSETVENRQDKNNARYKKQKSTFCTFAPFTCMSKLSTPI